MNRPRSTTNAVKPHAVKIKQTNLPAVINTDLTSVEKELQHARSVLGINTGKDIVHHLSPAKKDKSMRILKKAMNNKPISYQHH